MTLAGVLMIMTKAAAARICATKIMTTAAEETRMIKTAIASRSKMMVTVIAASQGKNGMP